MTYQATLTDEEREHIHAAIEMLGDYEATARENGNDSIAAGAGATRYVLEKLFRFLPSRNPSAAALPPQAKAEPAGVSDEAFAGLADYLRAQASELDVHSRTQQVTASIDVLRAWADAVQSARAILSAAPSTGVSTCPGPEAGCVAICEQHPACVAKDGVIGTFSGQPSEGSDA